MTRWRGGFVAVGDPGGDQLSGATPVWVSADGGTWSQLDSAVFGPATRVLGVGETAAGLVALTMQGGWPPSLTLQAWTSSDGVAWTPHPGPALGPAEELPTFRAGPAGLVVAIRAGTGAGQVAISRDGVAWEILSGNAFPAGWRLVEAMEATPSGFIAVGSATAQPGSQEMIALSSTDGRVWASHTIQAATPGIGRVVSRLVSGSAGFIAMGEEYQLPTGGRTASTASTTIWWSSLDGRTWKTLPKYPPLGAQRGPDVQECLDACPDGTLVGNGERMFAYRGHGKEVGWTSFDGRSWQPIAFEGSSPAREPGGWLTSLVVLPIGVIFQDNNGSTWFGAPVT